jgi:hypothetical protein
VDDDMNASATTVAITMATIVAIIIEAITIATVAT